VIILWLLSWVWPKSVLARFMSWAFSKKQLVHSSTIEVSNFASHLILGFSIEIGRVVHIYPRHFVLLLFCAFWFSSFVITEFGCFLNSQNCLIFLIINYCLQTSSTTTQLLLFIHLLTMGFFSFGLYLLFKCFLHCKHHTFFSLLVWFI
jgi:hypothetical protein